MNIIAITPSLNNSSQEEIPEGVLLPYTNNSFDMQKILSSLNELSSTQSGYYTSLLREIISAFRKCSYGSFSDSTPFKQSFHLLASAPPSYINDIYITCCICLFAKQTSMENSSCAIRDLVHMLLNLSETLFSQTSPLQSGIYYFSPNQNLLRLSKSWLANDSKEEIHRQCILILKETISSIHDDQGTVSLFRPFDIWHTICFWLTELLPLTTSDIATITSAFSEWHDICCEQNSTNIQALLALSHFSSLIQSKDMGLKLDVSQNRVDSLDDAKEQGIADIFLMHCITHLPPEKYLQFFSDLWKPEIFTQQPQTHDIAYALEFLGEDYILQMTEHIAFSQKPSALLYKFVLATSKNSDISIEKFFIIGTVVLEQIKTFPLELQDFRDICMNVAKRISEQPCMPTLHNKEAQPIRFLLKLLSCPIQFTKSLEIFTGNEILSTRQSGITGMQKLILDVCKLCSELLNHVLQNENTDEYFDRVKMNLIKALAQEVRTVVTPDRIKKVHHTKLKEIRIPVKNFLLQCIADIHSTIIDKPIFQEAFQYISKLDLYRTTTETSEQFVSIIDASKFSWTITQLTSSNINKKTATKCIDTSKLLKQKIDFAKKIVGEIKVLHTSCKDPKSITDSHIHTKNSLLRKIEEITRAIYATCSITEYTHFNKELRNILTPLFNVQFSNTSKIQELCVIPDEESWKITSSQTL